MTRLDIAEERGYDPYDSTLGTTVLRTPAERAAFALTPLGRALHAAFSITRTLTGEPPLAPLPSQEA